MQHTPQRGSLSVREGIARAAVRLFLERGFVATTVDDIAFEAGVSRRTYFRYFATKDDTILEYLDGLGERFAESLERRPAAEGLLRAMQNTTREVLAAEAHDTPLGRALTRLIFETPALRARHLAMNASWQPRIAEALGRRTGREDGAADTYLRLLASLMQTALDLGTQQWLAGDSGSLIDYIDEVFETIRTARDARQETSPSFSPSDAPRASATSPRPSA